MNTPDSELTQRHRDMRRALGAAVRLGILTHCADEIEALPQDYELDPGRGDAVQHLRTWARQDVAELRLTLSWAGSVTYPDGADLTQPAVIPCTAPGDVPVELVVAGEQRVQLASLLDAELRDPNTKCPTLGCGSPEDLDTTDVFGWTRLMVAGTDEIPRWYCSPVCVAHALTRAGAELAAADARAELDGGL